MPFVRIDLQHGKDAAYRRKIGDIVYEALVSAAGVPHTIASRSSPNATRRISCSTATIWASIGPMISS